MVISLGGSLIIPTKDKINTAFIKEFQKTLKKYYETHKFVVVTGGGSTARTYIQALKKQTQNPHALSAAGIRATRTNAIFLMQFFGKKESNDTLPMNMIQVKNNLRKNSVVFCGALRFEPNSTSDGTAAKLANYLKSPFVNLTNVRGLYTSNPKTNRKAKFIPKITWKDFTSITKKLKFKAGQHFVLDQNASIMIRKHKIPTYILGPNLKNLDNLLRKKKFIGTTIEN